jgi:ABC-type transport system substrate-binding protein
VLRARGWSGIWPPDTAGADRSAGRAFRDVPRSGGRWGRRDRGHRPARLNTIDITIGAPPTTSIARVIAGTEDYYAAPARSLNVMSPTQEARLQARYGAARGLAHQRFFENPSTIVWYLVFNTARGPFANARLRRAVSFAVDRKALVAEQGGLGPQRPTDQYLPPGVPGFRDVSIYPPGGDAARARRLAGRRDHHVTLITANLPPFTQRAQIVQANLAKIGIDVHIEPLSVTQLVHRELHADATWDLATIGWAPDFPDPSNVLNPLLRGPSADNKDGNFAHFDDPAYNRRLDAAARLSGPRATPPTPNSTPTSSAKRPRWPPSASGSTATSSPPASAARSTNRSTASTSPPSASATGERHTAPRRAPQETGQHRRH